MYSEWEGEERDDAPRRSGDSSRCRLSRRLSNEKLNIVKKSFRTNKKTEITVDAMNAMIL